MNTLLDLLEKAKNNAMYTSKGQDIANAFEREMNDYIHFLYPNIKKMKKYIYIKHIEKKRYKYDFIMIPIREFENEMLEHYPEEFI